MPFYFYDPNGLFCHIIADTAADLAFAKAGKFLKNTSKFKQVTDYAKGTKIGNKIFTHNADYESEIKRLRGIWKKLTKRSSPNLKPMWMVL